MDFPMKNRANQFLSEFLNKRASTNALRSLRLVEGLIDFSSNDYLGLANSLVSNNEMHHRLGSGGSRLISGNSKQAEETEEFLAQELNSEAALIFNSGYDANLGLLSTLPGKNATVFFDKLIHASMHDGIKLAGIPAFSFRHNDTNHLEELIKKAKGTLFVAIESMYSMEGDLAPMEEFYELVRRYDVHLIVDEAHAFGVFGEKGKGFSASAQNADFCYARTYTFSKAAGYHGACVLGSELLKSYLINTARSFIYSTALPQAAYAQIRNSTAKLLDADQNRQDLFDLIQLYQTLEKQRKFIEPCSTNSGPIQWLRIPDHEKAFKLASFLQTNGIDVRAILPPTVPIKQSRIRINMHSFNTENQLKQLFMYAEEFLI